MSSTADVLAPLGNPKRSGEEGVQVAVLMATYNGRSWIEEQVCSILNQRGVVVMLVVSDDLSTDGTWEWLQELAAQDQRVRLLPHVGRFGGAAKNFFRLIRDVDFSCYDYIALADQDDVWHDDKLKVAHESIVEGRYAAYSGNVTAFWPDGRQLLINKAQPQRKYDFLFEAAGPGCSYVLRVSAALGFKEFLQKNWLAVNEVALHDWLIYAWFRANRMGWYIDERPKIQYRQHGGNQVGANQGLRAMRGRLKMIRSGWYRVEISRIASLLAAQLSELPASIPARGEVPRLFLLRHITEVRRRVRDRLVFLFAIMLGFY
ncbi:glycosyltransferase [Cupriavidus sp. CuC1]|uniref:glycosyltransferase n=1 Tax=Cupriavidus sp. CuC1 TaxID=3373131 RepID=UPI0037CF09D3